MKEIYIYTENTVTLDLNNGSQNVVSLGSAPIVSLYDGTSLLDTITSISLGESVYSVTIPYQFTTFERSLQLQWSYAVNSVNIVRNEFINVITPYLSIEYLRSITDGSLDDLKQLEQTVRNIVNNYCAQSFGNKNKSIGVLAQSEYQVRLPERCWSVNSIYSQFDSTNDLFSSGSWILTDPYTLTTRSRYQLGEIYIGDGVVLGSSQPYPYGDSQYFIPRSYILNVTGNFGWETIPDDIIWSAKRLANNYLCNDDRYRVKQVQSVGSNTWTLQFNAGVYQSTGDIDVDHILSNYYIPRFGEV